MDKYFHENFKTNKKDLPLSEYFGKQNTTKSGLPCMKWSSPEVYKYDPVYGLTDFHSNYCRYWKPIDALRCFTDDKSLLWEECNPDDQETLFDQNMQFGEPVSNTGKEKFVTMMSKIFCEYSEAQMYFKDDRGWMIFNHTIVDEYHAKQDYFKKMDTSKNCRSERYNAEYNLNELVKYWMKINGVSS